MAGCPNANSVNGASGSRVSSQNSSGEGSVPGGRLRAERMPFRCTPAGDGAAHTAPVRTQVCLSIPSLWLLGVSQRVDPARPAVRSEFGASPGMQRCGSLNLRAGALGGRDSVQPQVERKWVCQSPPVIISRRFKPTAHKVQK